MSRRSISLIQIKNPFKIKIIQVPATTIHVQVLKKVQEYNSHLICM